MSIDPTDFVVAPDGQKSLKFANERQQAKFELAVCMAIHKWDDLTTAVDNSWGGPQSADKRDWISAVVIDLFDEKELDLVAIEETILNAMVDEFEVEIDNDSGLITAALIIKLYRDCAIENYTMVDNMYAQYQEKLARGKVVQKVEIQEDPYNPSTDTEATDASSMVDSMADSMDVDETIPEAVEHEGPVVDDDGFELVQRRRR